MSELIEAEQAELTSCLNTAMTSISWSGGVPPIS